MTREPTVSFGGERVPLSRITGIARTESGELVVVDGGVPAIYLVRRNGSYVEVGRPGDGPGEFRDPVVIPDRSGHFGAIVDRRRRRAMSISQDGVLADIPSLNVSSMGSSIPIAMQDTSRLLVVGTSIHGGESALLRDGLIQVSMKYMLLDLVQQDTTHMAVMVHPTEWRHNGRSHPLPANARPGAAMTRDGVVLMDPRRPQLDEYDLYGRLQRVVALDIPASALPDDLMNSVSTSDARRAGMEIPATLPYFSRLLVDTEDRRWVELYNSPDARSERVWVVIDPNGLTSGTVIVPSEFQAFAIGDEWIAGVARDSNDVETVQMYGLVKGSRD